MANYYSDMANDYDDTNIMDDDLLELESDFARSNVEPPKLKRAQMEEKIPTALKNVNKNFDWLNDDKVDKPESRRGTTPTGSRRNNVRFSEDDILDTMGLDDVKSKEGLDKTKKESILTELFGKSSSETKVGGSKALR